MNPKVKHELTDVTNYLGVAVAALGNVFAQVPQAAATLGLDNAAVLEKLGISPTTASLISSIVGMLLIAYRKPQTPGASNASPPPAPPADSDHH